MGRENGRTKKTQKTGVDIWRRERPVKQIYGIVEKEENGRTTEARSIDDEDSLFLVDTTRNRASAGLKQILVEQDLSSDETKTMRIRILKKTGFPYMTVEEETAKRVKIRKMHLMRNGSEDATF